MITRLKPYPAYKDSGVPWLDDIPAHWETERAKWLFRKMKRPVRPDDDVVTCFRDGTVTLRKNRRVLGFTNALKEIGYQGVRKGDLVIHAMDAFAGAVGVSDSDGKCTPVYAVCQPQSDASPHYYAYIVREMARSQWIAALAKGVRERSTDFRFVGFAAQVVPIPPRDEQDRITAFLGFIDRRTRRYIRAQRKLIALLEEQKQALIQRAVTRGLDPNVWLKSSGVEWLGEIPEHWETVPLKNLASIQSGITLGKNYLNREVLEYPYLRVANVQDGHLILSEVKTVSIPIEEAMRSMLQKGDVLMTEGGDPDKLGRGCVWDGQIAPCLHQNHIFAVRTRRERLQPHFLAALLSSQYAKIYFLRSAKQTTNLASTNRMTIGRLPVPLPSLEEQAELLAYLRTKTDRLDQGMANIRCEIDLIREYRTRLIADVVTGKLDVREAAANLPDEADAPEDWDADGTEEESDEDLAQADGEADDED